VIHVVYAVTIVPIIILMAIQKAATLTMDFVAYTSEQKIQVANAKIIFVLNYRKRKANNERQN